MIKVDNYIVLEKDVKSILEQLKFESGKLDTIEEKDSGDWKFRITCPNRDHKGGHEAKPSCGYNPKDDFYNCFTCGAHGSLWQLVKEAFECDDETAKNWLKQFGHKAAEKIVIGEDIKKKSNTIISEAEDASELDNYQDYCPYLKQRGLSVNICKKLDIKYDQAHRQIVFPCRDIYGKTIALLRRSVDTKYFYIPENIGKPVYCIDLVEKYRPTTLLICEGLIDCAKANEFLGDRGVAVATLGTPDETQINSINNLKSIKKVYVFTDSDEAGRRFSKYIRDRLSSKYIVSDVIIHNGKKDIGDLSYEEFWRELVASDINNGIVKKKTIIF